MSDIRSCYAFHRANGMRAFLALEATRTDLEKRVDRYPVATGWNRATEGTKARWIENTASCGLRLVGAAHDIVRLNHTGWHTDPDGSESIHGVVYQLPSRNGRPVYVSGHNDANNDGAAFLDFGSLFYGDVGGNEYHRDSDCRDKGARDAARYADQIAEREAEEEREYQTAWQAGSRFAQCLEDYRTTRKTLLAQLKHLRGLMCLEGHETTRAIIERICNDGAELRAECFKEMSELREGNRDELIYYPDTRLRAAFNEGAGIDG